MRIFITGGAGFVGSHAAEFYAKKGHDVTVYDSLARARLLKRPDKNTGYNWKYLSAMKNVRLVRGDITDAKKLGQASRGHDHMLHLAAQTAVTTSVTDPRPDFNTNALGTFNALEAARLNDIDGFVYASTNKVYGENVNSIGLRKLKTRWAFEPKWRAGINEKFPTDLCEHTPYGCSKLTGDLYTQDYGHLYGLRTGVFRMSCIYGARQFGVEDQGWVAWFTIATVLGKPLTIYGDGRQVRDVLYVSDLVALYDRFLQSKLRHGVFNTGGGASNTLSLLELLDLLEKYTGRRSKLSYADWRPSDQKVYISDIRQAWKALKWQPKVTPQEGVKKLVEWVEENRKIL